ncbi:hypothetical protein RhiJN_05416 [Ceratobasidium sp. AG-Ba]|nr:hypothetical protein RhiJN_05416 [Ceratobasidium sp. AG-Ba]
MDYSCYGIQPEHTRYEPAHIEGLQVAPYVHVDHTKGSTTRLVSNTVPEHSAHITSQNSIGPQPGLAAPNQRTPFQPNTTPVHPYTHHYPQYVGARNSAAEKSVSRVPTPFPISQASPSNSGALDSAARCVSLAANNVDLYRRAPTVEHRPSHNYPMDYMAHEQGQGPTVDARTQHPSHQVGQNAFAAPVASQLANLTLARNEEISRMSLQPSQALGRQHQRAASPPEFAFVDTDSEMPDVATVICSTTAGAAKGGPVADTPSAPKQNSKPVTGARRETDSKPNRKNKSKDKTTGTKAEEKAATTTWTSEEFDTLVRHIAGSDDLFKHSQQKGPNLDFWNRVTEELFGSKKKGESTRAQWKKAEKIYVAVKAFELFTGGDGDGDDHWVVGESDDEEAAVLKLTGRLAYIRQCKPNIDQNREIKTGEMYREWTRGGDDSLYRILHERFKDIETFEREIPRHSGMISDPDTDSKSDTNGSTQNSNGKKHKSDLATTASTTEKFFAAKDASAKAKHEVALQRLELERSHMQVANMIALDTHKLRKESQKRKWSNDKRMARLKEEEAKRRRMLEDTTAREKHVMDRIRSLQELVNTTTNPTLIEMYQKRIDLALAELPQVLPVREPSADAPSTD